jgi:hypothetical protein
MHIHINDALVRQRLRTSVIFLVLATSFLISGFFLSSAQDDVTTRYFISLPCLVIGLLFWFQNQTFLARWGPRGRHDATLQKALKGLDSRYHFFAFPGSGLPDYLLVGPIGVVALLPLTVNGTVRCDGERWAHQDRIPGLLRTLLRITQPQANLGHPTEDSQRAVEQVRGYLERSEGPIGVPISSVIVFLHANVRLEQNSCTCEATYARTLRNPLRKLSRSVDASTVDEVAKVLEGAK